MPRDAQRQKVYAWERAHVWPLFADATHQLTLPACERLVQRVFQRYGQKAPKVYNGRGKRNASWSLYGIQLPRWARTTWVVLHECAHGLQHVFAPDDPHHGAAFMGLYLELLHRFGKVPRRQLQRSAQAAGLQVAWAAYCEPPDFKLVRQLASLRNQELAAWSHYKTLQQQRIALERQLKSS